MKKTLKGNMIALRLGVTNESFYEYIGLFNEYFNQATHHISYHHAINKDAILVYSYFPSTIDCTNCKQKQIILNIQKEENIMGIAFYDEMFSNLPCCNLHEIRYDNRRMGHLCIKNNIFCTTDIAHSSGNIPHIKKIFETLILNKLLFPVFKSDKNVITLGADPELESIVDGKIVPGNTRPQVLTYEKIYISADGARNQRELRPDPTTSPGELVENIRDLIKISSFFGEELSVLGKKFSLGGHIHIGGAMPSIEVIEALDYFLSPFNVFNSKTRETSKYGKKGDFRFQPHGFEYRTPPSAWLLTPKLATMTLDLTKTVVEQLINKTDVSIDTDLDWEIYKKNLKQLGYDDMWVDEFLKEIEWAKENIHEPLAKLWNVEVPDEFKAHKQYTFKPTPESITEVEYNE